ncbi:MAG: hypothetical protein M5U19_20340 [Microthrixaceae bacterium]|nr:hypothetical protein [Microthrixaceae bacterium]
MENQSMREDLRIIARTFTTMLSGEGVEGHPTDDPLAVPDPDGPPVGDPPGHSDAAGAEGTNRS